MVLKLLKLENMEHFQKNELYYMNFGQKLAFLQYTPPRKDGRSGTQNFKVPSVLISTNFTTPSVLISTNITKSVYTVILIFFLFIYDLLCYL